MMKIHIIEDDLSFAAHLKEEILVSTSIEDIDVYYYNNVVDIISGNRKFYSNDVLIIDSNLSDWSMTHHLLEEIDPSNNAAVFLMSAHAINQNVKDEVKKYGYNLISKFDAFNNLSNILINHLRESIPLNTNRQIQLIKHDIDVINSNLFEYLLRNPKDVYKLNPRKFEELVADLFTYEGYSVTLTSNGSDGGKDIYASKKDYFNEYLFAIECKKYDELNKVGRPIINKLYGVVESERLTGGIVATTSFFTQPAIDFKNKLNNRIFLRDYFDIMEMIKNTKK